MPWGSPLPCLDPWTIQHLPSVTAHWHQPAMEMDWALAWEPRWGPKGEGALELELTDAWQPSLELSQDVLCQDVGTQQDALS